MRIGDKDVPTWVIVAGVLAALAIWGNATSNTGQVEIRSYQPLSPSRLQVVWEADESSDCTIKAFIGGSQVGFDIFNDIPPGRMNGTLTIENEEAAFVDDVQADC